MIDVQLDRPRWWQWPTVVSLDAPLVSVVWLLLFAHLAAMAMSGAPVFVLAASVWLAYAADRWLEAGRLSSSQFRTARHHFYFRNRRVVAVVWLAVLAADVTVALRTLTSLEIRAGLVLLAMVLAYVLSHQYLHRKSPWRAPKELVIALLLTSGVALFLIGQPAFWPLVAPLVGFALLCFTNCALISVWEHDVDLAQDQTSLARQEHVNAGAIKSLPWLVVLVAAGLYVSGGPQAHVAAICIAVSAALLAGVDAIERRAGWPLARVLADVVLLTPIVPLIWMT